MIPIFQVSFSTLDYCLNFDTLGYAVSYDMSSPDALIKTIQNLVLNYSWSLEEAIQFSTSNTVKYLNFKQKGFIVEHYDADIIGLNQTDLSLLYVPGKG